MNIIATFIPTEAEIHSLAQQAEAHGLMLLTRVHPVTRKQQTVIGVRPMGEWKRLHINAKQAVPA